MKNIKTILLATLMSFMLAVSTTAMANQNSSDLGSLFGCAETEVTTSFSCLELVSLSDAEMVATESEILPLVVAVARVGYAVYKATKATTATKVMVARVSVAAGSYRLAKEADKRF